MNHLNLIEKSTSFSNEGFLVWRGDDWNVETDGPLGPQGSPGPQGAQGAQGDVGPQGASNAQGPQGDQGAQGDIGPQGSIGQQGPQGDQGAQGTFNASSQGPQGPQGNVGQQGAYGVGTPIGNQGSQGVPGSVGAQGSDTIDSSAVVLVFTIVSGFVDVTAVGLGNIQTYNDYSIFSGHIYGIKTASAADVTSIISVTVPGKSANFTSAVDCSGFFKGAYSDGSRMKGGIIQSNSGSTEILLTTSPSKANTDCSLRFSCVLKFT